MSFLRHLLPHCVEPIGMVPVFIGDEQIGWTTSEFVSVLCDGKIWHIQDNKVQLDNGLSDFSARSDAIHRHFLSLSEKGILPDLPDYSALGGDDWFGIGRNHELCRVHRFYSKYLSILRHAVMVNGYQDDKYWAARRSQFVDYGKDQFDTMVAGAVRIGDTVEQTVLEEGEQECGLSEAEMPHLIPETKLFTSYRTKDGFLIREIFHIFDFDTAGRFTPRVTNPHEVAEFQAIPIKEMIDFVEHTDKVKSQINFVLIDFFVRHNYLTNQHPEYSDILKFLDIMRKNT